MKSRDFTPTALLDVPALAKFGSIRKARGLFALPQLKSPEATRAFFGQLMQNTAFTDKGTLNYLGPTSHLAFAGIDRDQTICSERLSGALTSSDHSGGRVRGSVEFKKAADRHKAASGTRDIRTFFG